MVEKTLTVECIGNPANGDLLGTATWKGFSVYDLLKNLGIKDGASSVKYLCADGYFTFNTLEELQNREVLGALYMNGEHIPAKYGFPLRIIFPGYHGVRQPGWVVEIELLETGIEDYWSQTQMEIWNTDSSMDIDSKIFFPENNDTLTLGENVIFLNLIDCSAVNTIIECIVRHTPLLVNPLPAVVEYLGEDYPLYYNDLNHAAQLLIDEDKVLQAHCYLRDMDKSHLGIECFVSNVCQFLRNR